MFATSGTADIAYQEWGDGDGVPVLLIHAGVTDRRSWRHVVERLRARHRCVAFDARGYGETRYAEEPGWSAVDDALAVMDAAGLQRPAVVAGSIGGQAAIDLALAHPDRVAGLALIGSAIRGAPYPDPSDEREIALNERVEAADADGDVAETNRLDAWLWLDGPRSPEGRVGGRPRELFLDMNGRALQAADPGEPAEPRDAWPRLAEIAVPTLFLVGRLDAEEIRVVDEQASTLIPGARLRFLDGVAHLPHLENDPVTLDAIAEFVDELG